MALPGESMVSSQPLEDYSRRKVLPALREIDIEIHWYVVVTCSTVRLFDFGLIVKPMPRPFPRVIADTVFGVHWIVPGDRVD
ncbi:MAG: hypothetical protein WBG92_18935 [Thiohalocapsa sp.]